MNDTFTRGISRILLILFFMLAGFTSFAQYTKTSLETGRSKYSAMAKDQSGNLFVVRANAAGTAYELVKYTNGTGTAQILYSNLQQDNGVPPIGLAINTIGDVFVTSMNSTDGWEILKLPAPANNSPTVVHSGSYYSVLAIDQSNNLLSLEWDGGSNYQVVRYPFGAEQVAGTVVWSGLPLPSGLSSTYPAGLVTDSHGNIFLTDFLENSGGRLIKLTSPGFGATVLATNRGFTALAVDGADNLYINEATATANVAQIVKYTDPTQTGQVLYNQLSYDVNAHPYGLVVMPNGNIFANSNGSAPEVVKLAPPNINVSSVVRAGGNPTNAASVTYTVTFSGSAAGVTTSAFTLVPTGVSGASITSVTGSGTTYTVTVNTGSGSGTLGLNVNGTGISPVVANAPYTGQVYTVDKVAPTGSIVINSGATYTNNVNVTLTLTGNDANPPLQMAFSLDGGTYSADEAFATTKAIALPATDGTRTVAMRLKDAAGNTVIYSDDIILDRVAPNTTISAGPLDPTTSTTANFIFNASEANCTFQGSLDGGAFTPVTSPITLTGLADGPHTFQVRAIDPAGNIDPTPASYTWTIDATGPQITSVGVPTNGYYKAGTTLDFKVNYNEPAIVDQTAGTPYINLIIGLDAVQVPYIGGTGTNQLTFRYTVQQGEMDMDGITVQPLVQNNSGFIKDALGNDASTSLQNVGNTTLVRINTSIPSVTLSTATVMPTNAPFTVTATFSEAVSGLTVSDFNVLNTTVSNLQTSDNITYTVLMTPASAGTRPISLPSGAALNIGGNPNTPSNTLTYTYDPTAPTVTSVAVPANGYHTEGDPLTFTVKFSEDIFLNTTGGTPALNITIGGTPVSVPYVGTSGVDGLTFGYIVANGDMDMDGITINALTLNGATIRDAASNNANLTLNNVGPTTGVFVNTAHPSVAITSTAPAIVNAPYTATITFSEAVSDFDISGITTGNASLSSLNTSDNITYTVLVTPTTDGTVTLNIAANMAHNIAGNGNNASNTLSRIYDIAPPSVTAVDVPPNGYYKAGSIMDFTVHFSENITLNTSGGTPQLSLTFGSSTVNATYNGTSGTDALNFQYTVVNGDMDMDGIQVSALVLNGSTIKDIANNNAVLTLNNVANTTGIFVNTQHPSVALTTTAPALVNAPFTVTVTFSENVTGLDPADFSVTNATVGSLASINSATYTVLVTPTADGPVSISLPAGAAVNIGDNDNTASNTLNHTYDGTVPVVTSVAVPANGYYKAGTTLDFIVRFSENIVLNTSGGNPTLALTVGAATVNAIFTGTNGTDGLNFTYTVQSGDMDMDGIVINSLVLNGATLKDDATNNADLTLNNVGNTATVRVNTSIPTVTLSTTAADPTNAPFTVTATFSEAVTGLDLSDFTVSNATLSSLNTTDNITYTLLFFPSSDGPTSISLPADAAVNIGDNGNTASNVLSRVYDATAPTVTSVAVPANKYYRAGETLNFTVNFSENIFLNTTGGTPSLRVTIGTIPVQAAYTGTVGNNALTFAYTVVNGDMDMDGITVNALNLNGATLRDAATNNANLTLNNIAPTTGVFVNTTHPSVAITSAAPAIVNVPFTATITFSEAVSNFVIGDITATNAALSNLTTTDNITYTVLVTPPADGTVTLNIAADVAENIGANGNTASNTLSRLYDAAPPAVTAVDVPANGYYNAGTHLDFIVHFSENITLNTTGGNPALSLTIGSSTVNATYTGTSGTDALNFSYTVVNGDMDMDGITVGNLLLNGSTIVDAANNAAVLTLNNVGNTTNVFVNTQHPTVTLSTTAPAFVNAPYTVTATFSEAVTGLVAGDFRATNATFSNLQTADNITYTVLVTPTADGPVSVYLLADAAFNIGANGNTASNTVNNTYDGTVPTVTAVAVPANGYYKAGTTLDFIVRFSENITLNTSGGNPALSLTIGTATVNAAYTGLNGTDGLNFSYTVQNGDMDMDGIVVNSLALNGATIKDVATNDAVLTLNNVGNTSNVFVNTAHPSVTISTPSASSVNTPFTVDIAFSENVTGFTSADIAVTNGNASPVTVIDNAHYSIIVVPTAEGVVSVNIPADVAANIGGNGNTASNTLSITYDITKPTVTSVTVPADKYYNAGQVLNFTVNFDEDVNLNMPPAADPYLTLTIGAATMNATYAGASSARELNFSYTVVNGDQDMDGITVGTLVLNGSSIKDAADNDADLTLNNIGNTTQVRVNTTNPSVTLSSTANTLINAPFTVTATFSEAVTILTESDFSVTNATLSGLTSSDNITYTVTVTPTADGAVSIQVPANAVVNIGGNSNTPSNTLNFTYDGTKPSVTAVVVPVNGYYKAGDVLNFTVNFSENINLNTAGGAPYLNVVLGSGTVRAAYTVATANSLSFSYTVQPGDMDLDGITLGTLNLNGSTIKDDATNDADLALNNVGNTSQVFVHTGSPSVQLSTTAATRVNAPFTVTAVFNEAVTGLAVADFTVTNGTASNLQTTDNITYTLTVTPAADGAVTIQLPAAQAQNVVFNGNTASNTLSVTYDATAPAITTGLAFEVLERSAVGTLVGQVTATDASGIIQNWTIASDASIGAFSIDANGNIRVADQAKLNAAVNTTVNLTITVTDGLNTSVAVPVTVQVKLVNQSPTLDAIDNVTICPDGQEHTIQLSGASAVEPGQTYGFTIITDKAANFDKLSVTAAGLITYQLKTSASGTSTVTVTIKDNGGIANGGTDTLRRSFNIEVATLGAITISSDKGNNISKGDIVHLTATGGTHYQWDNADGILSGQQSATLEVRPMQNTTYHVTASNDMGCINTADFTVSVVADFKVDAVNLLTPNGDGKNDKWVIRNLDSYPNNEVKIFDRTGRLVYTRRNYSNDWDGTMNGSPLAEGTYYYILTIEGGAKTAKGYITIIRDRN
ncbi:Ig-like domain-containing protein [Chitinophaga filiformis]|uniref:Gliding motility-associated C-terminal domain-containing protein n=1 Tax=Chitinophaga filiformis TaxID=104663 RepID=A0A1G8D1B4_CHIFI|nr:Ig-like domain-containing protein [Chitinophaga filiformis]SDH51565.1 gliding motility-associated C-terminal domain-containing protein [Chitinophaga filiformis]